MLRLSFCGVSHSHFPHFGKPTQLFTKLRTWYQCAYKLPRLALLDYNIWLHCSTKFFSVLLIVANHYLENFIPFPATATLHGNMLHFNYKIDSPICRKVYENASFLLLHIKRLLSNRQGCIRPINFTFDFLQELNGKQDLVQSINFLIAY